MRKNQKTALWNCLKMSRLKKVSSLKSRPLQGFFIESVSLLKPSP
jgi:hypothetical protein